MTVHDQPLARPTHVVSVGETMAVVAPSEVGPLERASSFLLGAGGAESNVLMHLARLGRRTRFVTRLGDDALGRRVAGTIAKAGVDTSHVFFDPEHRTGVYFKDPGAMSTTVHYYRDRSAASFMNTEDLRRVDLAGSRVLYLSGITPALSVGCASLVSEAMAAAREAGTHIAFDVNYRPALWHVSEAGPALLELARRADTVLVGLDEAETLWGVRTASATRELFERDSPVLVIKDGSVGATEFTADDETFVPAHVVDVVEPVGAGDAFAAGYLNSWLDGGSSRARLQSGHLNAATALRTMHDVPEGDTL